MLQPKSYPELVGKALVLESDPFVVMIDDDDPWVEGLFLIICVGLLIGIARLIGGLLMWASLPSGDALLAALLQGWRQLAPIMGVTTSGTLQFDETIRQAWAPGTFIFGYGSLWMHVFAVVAIPFVLLAQWVIVSGISHAIAKALGGTGSLNRTFGATALMVAPQILYVFGIVPFVSISSMLLGTWAILITYRAIEVAHELPWQRAAVAALGAPALLLLLMLAGIGLISFLLVVGLAGGVA